MTVPGKGGPPKGSRNAAGPRKPIRYQDALQKALKRPITIRKTDPSWGKDPERWEKDLKGLKPIDRIAQLQVFQAEMGDKDAREKMADRLDGKAVSKTENETTMKGQVEHKGLTISFEAPKAIDVTPKRVIEHDKERA